MKSLVFLLVWNSWFACREKENVNFFIWVNIFQLVQEKVLRRENAIWMREEDILLCEYEAKKKLNC